MKDPEVLIMSEEWMTLKEAEDRLGKKQRSLQKLAKAGHLRTKRQPRKGRGPETLYFAEDVERLVDSAPPKRARAAKETAAAAPKPSRALALASDKPTLDVANVFLSCLDKAQKANDALLSQMEMQAKLASETLKDVVSRILADRSADREDERYRFDALRKDKRERLQSRHAHGAPKRKA